MRIYIAGPYTKGDTALNVRKACQLADYITTTTKHIPFVPHLSHFWHMMFPRPYEFWMRYDLEWLRLCGALIRYEGESTGADDEARNHMALGRPIHFFREFDLPSLNELDLWLAGLK